MTMCQQFPRIRYVSAYGVGFSLLAGGRLQWSKLCYFRDSLACSFLTSLPPGLFYSTLTKFLERSEFFDSLESWFFTRKSLSLLFLSPTLSPSLHIFYFLSVSHVLISPLFWTASLCYLCERFVVYDLILPLPHLAFYPAVFRFLHICLFLWVVLFLSFSLSEVFSVAQFLCIPLSSFARFVSFGFELIWCHVE